MSAHQLKRTIWGLHKGSYKTAWYLCHRIRAAMSTVEKPRSVEPSRLAKPMSAESSGAISTSRGMGRCKKQIVIGLRQRGGETRFFHAEDAKSGTLAQYIKDNVSEDVEMIVTDEFSAYPAQ